MTLTETNTESGMDIRRKISEEEIKMFEDSIAVDSAIKSLTESQVVLLVKSVLSLHEKGLT